MSGVLVHMAAEWPPSRENQTLRRSSAPRNDKEARLSSSSTPYHETACAIEHLPNVKLILCHPVSLQHIPSVWCPMPSPSARGNAPTVHSQLSADGMALTVTSCTLESPVLHHSRPFFGKQFNSPPVLAYVPFLNAIACYYLCSVLLRSDNPGRYQYMHRPPVDNAHLHTPQRHPSLFPLQCIS
jgi:hypothetical protein